jgi:hypothetical protein
MAVCLEMRLHWRSAVVDMMHFGSNCREVPQAISAHYVVPEV